MSKKIAKKTKVKKTKVRLAPTPTIPEIKAKSEKERLLELYQTLKDLNINSISDLENLIARAE